MDYKKLHKDTINRLQQMVNSGKITVETACGICADFVLESEDERIRKELIAFIKKQEGQTLPNNGETWIAWLEKQGEKPIDKVEPKFKVGDWITNGIDFTFQIHSIEDNMYLRSDDYFIDIETADKKFRLWTIQDAKDGDVLNSPSYRLIWIYKDNGHYHACVNMNYVTGNTAVNGQIVIPNDAYPAIKNEQTILFAKMKEAGYEWDAEKKELKKIEQKPINKIEPDILIEESYQQQADDLIDTVTEKPAWSEDDETVLNNLIWALKEDMVLAGDRDEYVSWLQSLKDKTIPQPKQEWSEEDERIVTELIGIFESAVDGGHVTFPYRLVKDYIRVLKLCLPQSAWKPSDEQLDNLSRAFNGATYNNSLLMQLYIDLKKLKEE